MLLHEKRARLLEARLTKPTQPRWFGYHRVDCTTLDREPSVRRGNNEFIFGKSKHRIVVYDTHIEFDNLNFALCRIHQLHRSKYTGHLGNGWMVNFTRDGKIIICIETGE